MIPQGRGTQAPKLIEIENLMSNLVFILSIKRL